MIHIALVEDQEDCANLIKEFTERYGREEGEETLLHWYRDGMDFIDAYKEGEYDIVFMDIEMPHISGLKTAQKLRRIDPVVPLVFVTVMAQLAIKGYEVAAMDFIVKPITYFNFALKIKKASINNRRERTVVLRLLGDDGAKEYIVSSDIYYIESCDHRCIFHTKKGDFYQYISISELEERLLPFRFLRSNNSFIVNPAYITTVKKDSVVIMDEDIPVARARKKEFMEKLTKYFKYVF